VGEDYGVGCLLLELELLVVRLGLVFLQEVLGYGGDLGMEVAYFG